MKKKSQHGFTLLLAALVSSIVLSLGASIFLIAQKELTLSSLGRDSQYAFYAADQAAECALYWDERWQYFGTSTPAAVVPPNPKCDAQSLLPSGQNDMPGRPGSPVIYPYIMSFTYQPSSAGQSYCAKVFVEKCDGTISGAWDYVNNQAQFCTSAVPPVIHTTIHADGYSTSCGTIGTNPRALQRSVELHY